MQDRTSELVNAGELKFARDHGFFDSSLSLRALIAALFVLALFIVLHFREVSVEVLDLHSVANSYIVSQVDFDFYDEEATIILRQEAVRDVGKIYRVSEPEVRQRGIEFENFLIYNQDWRRYSDASAFDQLYAGVEGVERVLEALRFTDPRTLNRFKEIHASTQQLLIYTPTNLDESAVLPDTVWETVRQTALTDPHSNPATVDLVVGFFKPYTWWVEEDIPAQQKLRTYLQKKVPEKYTHVSAGSRIIDQGEKVTTRHMAMLQAMKRAVSEQRNLWSPSTILGSLIMSLLLAGLCLAYLKANYQSILNSNRKLFLLITVIILTLALAKATEFFLLNSKSNLFQVVRYPLFVPFASILLASLMNSGIATFAAGFLTILMTMTLVFEAPGFMIMNLAAAVVAILTTRTLQRRKEIFIVCAKAWLACVAMILSLHFYHQTLWQVSLVSDILCTGVFMLLTAVLVVGLLPLLESAFRVMTDVTLMEYMDPNNDVLRRLTIEAPGTYQHSVVVGNLAEAGAIAIGANGLFCRVATLYHDIGKMATPQYFTENQQPGVNVHQLLTPAESAQVIMAHVSEGVAMARKAGLPEQFIDLIKEHHGTTLVYYFYRKQLELMGGDKSLVDEKDFRYQGPKPRSKEAVIIMIADTLEAASRSLEKINEEALNELANRLIREKADDGQFDECLLTFEELAIVKATLVRTLVAFGHSRIKYPKRESPSSERDVEELKAEA